jgi:hypothetical protein
VSPGRAAIAGALLTLTVSSCVAPAFDSGAYEENAVHALDSATGETRTAAIALDAALQGRVSQAYLDTVVSASEQALGPVQDSFGAVDAPSTADDKLRDRVTSLLQDASDGLTDARIAVRRHDRPGMRDAVTTLRKAADALETESDDLTGSGS